MSDLISKSALLEKVGKIEIQHFVDHKGRYRPLVKTEKILNCIEDEPTVDAVPVVRCKDCVHWGNERASEETENAKLCDYYHWMMFGEKYCANGERRCKNESFKDSYKDL